MSPSIHRSIAPVAVLLLAALACDRGGELSEGGAATDTATTGAPAAVSLDDAEFRNPESVLYDSVGDVYFVSNVNGDGDAADDNGFISRVRPDGSVDSLHFVLAGRAGAVLNAPKGMAIVGNTLWVADLDAIRAFDRRDGRAVGSIALKSGGARFLNDVALGPDGALYVSDTHANRVFRVGPNLQPSTAIISDSLQGPNGLLWLAAASGAAPAADSTASDSAREVGDSVRVGASPDSTRPVSSPDSTRPDSSPDSARLGAFVDSVMAGQGSGLVIASFNGDALWLWSPADSSLRAIARGVGGFDGLARLADGRIVVSSLTKGGIYALEGDSLVLLADQKGVADLTADPKRGRLILPLLDQNQVRILEVARLDSAAAG